MERDEYLNFSFRIEITVCRFCLLGTSCVKHRLRRLDASKSLLFVLVHENVLFKKCNPQILIMMPQRDSINAHNDACQIRHLFVGLRLYHTSSPPFIFLNTHPCWTD